MTSENMHVIGISGLDRNVQFKMKCFPDLSSREYRIAQGFDSAAALVSDGTIVAAAAQERFSRAKGTGSFPVDAVRYCLDAGGLTSDGIDVVAHAFDYASVRSYYDTDEFHQAQYEELYAPEVQLSALEEHFPGEWRDRFVSVPHHLTHAASAFYPSGFDEALVLITDGMGEIHSLTAYLANGEGFEVLRQIPALHSLGVLYGVFTLYLGFFLGLDEYKVMGLAPYGDSRRYYNQIMQHVRLNDDGTYLVPLLAANKTILEKETHRGVLKVLEEQFGPAREAESAILQHHMDIAAGLQAVLQTCQLHVLTHLKRETGQTNLCMAGGVALNCTANGVIKRSRLFKRMFIQPAAGDDGSALGAALYVERQRRPKVRTPTMTVPLLGPDYSDEDIRTEIEARADCVTTRYGSFAALADEVAQRIAEGQIVAFFQGRMEYGPRALGSRSILADPRRPEMRDRINSLVKKREGFRPFAPAVVEESAATYFGIDATDANAYAHMLYVVPVRKEYRDQLPAITHVDGSARPQTVSRDHNERFWMVLKAFGTLTGMPVVLNTSFNVRGQPIVCTPTEAVDTFLDAGLDALVIGNQLVQASKAGTTEALADSAEAAPVVDHA